jgi:ubiquinol-cytochrome c reductase subunit 8
MAAARETNDERTGSPTQKGTVTYSLSPNRQRPLAGAARNAVFNTFRRTSHQIFYFAPPLVAGYYLMHWAIERYGLRLTKIGVMLGR